MKEFRKLLNRYMKDNSLSKRAFAHKVGVGHSTINRIMDEEASNIPDLPTLLKISEVVHVDLLTLVGTIYPDSVPETVDNRVINAQLDQMTDQEREVVKQIISGILGNKNDNTE